jgi:hypothetical protein
MAQNNLLPRWLRRRVLRSSLADQQHRDQVRAHNVDNVNKLAHPGDAEFIATSPGPGNQTHQMG